MYIYRIIKPRSYCQSFSQKLCLRKLGQSFRSILTINHHRKLGQPSIDYNAILFFFDLWWT